MKFELDHIGIAVNDLESVLDVLRRAFGIEPSSSEQVSDQKVRIIGYDLNGPLIEYFEPSEENSPVHKFLQKRGNAIHHIALRVENLEARLADLKQKGFALIDEKPRTGAGGKKIAFLHPRDFNGILIELCESGP